MSPVATAELVSNSPDIVTSAIQQLPADVAPAVLPVHSFTEPTQRNHLLPEFSLKDKVIVVSGGGRGLGLVQIEALLEAGAKGMVLPQTQNTDRIFEAHISSVNCSR